MTNGKSCIACNSAAKFSCPTCLKNDIKDSYFCSQECFQKNWGSHKQMHPQKVVPYNPWPGYQFSGKLRPFPVTPRRPVKDSIRKPDYADTSIPTSELAVKQKTKIEILDSQSIDKMRTVCKMTKKVLDIAASAIKVGITTEEIDALVHETCMEMNAYPSPLNYHSFPKSCCTSVNEVICHGIPDKRPLEDGDILNIDISIYYDGFHGDANATYLVGNVDEKGKELVNTTRECLEKAIAIVKPGVPYRDLGSIIEKHAQSKGFSVVRTYCGHGINSLFHCAPSVPHYSKNKAIGVMTPGHVFTIEPMINEGHFKDLHWPDNWTAVTIDGKRSAQFEHTLLVTETGCEILTQ